MGHFSCLDLGFGIRSQAWSSTAWSTRLLFCSWTYGESSVHTVEDGWGLSSLEEDTFVLAGLVADGFLDGLLFGQRDGGEQVSFCVVYKRVGYPICQASVPFLFLLCFVSST